jgi:RNA recognition motif-containing protein
MRQDNRRPRSRGGQRRPRRGDYEPVSRTPEKKQSFFQKIASFFTGGKKQTNGSPRPAEARTSNNNSSNNNNQRQPQSSRADRPERSERQSRKPEIIEVSSPKLYVGNLSFDATESDLFDLFNGVGKVLNAEIVSNKYTQKSKGFAFVTLQTVDEARRAVTELHDKEFMGRKLVVSGAKTNDAVSSRERDNGSDNARAESDSDSEPLHSA